VHGHKIVHNKGNILCSIILLVFILIYKNTKRYIYRNSNYEADDTQGYVNCGKQESEVGPFEQPVNFH